MVCSPRVLVHSLEKRFQSVNNIVFVGRYVIGCGKLYTEHALVCIEGYLSGVA